MNYKKTILALTVSALTLSAGQVLAKVSAEEAAKLGNELTPMGAERAGNADGSIPAWTDAPSTLPAGHKDGEFRVDVFADEKPLFTIDASNYQQYADGLSEGQKMMFVKYPDTFRMDIYPTHRTGAAPQWVYDNTAKNSLTAELTSDGNGIVKANGGVTFPIPKNGLEVIWNHNLRWKGEGVYKKYRSTTIYPGSHSIGGGTLWETYPFFNQGKYDPDFNGNVMELMLEYNAPVRRKGEVVLVHDPIDQSATPRQAWQYIPGQRRVRRAPTISHDTPNPGANGLTTYDDAFMFNGSPERFDWKLVGKKEAYVLYNNNKFAAKAGGTEKDHLEVLQSNHIDPAFERWEKHRVWIVEGTLKEGKRHVYGKRTFYIDEDSWSILSADSFDGRGNLWRGSFTHMLNAYDVPAAILRGSVTHDFQIGAYYVGEMDSSPIKVYEGESGRFYTPGQVRKMSRR